MDAEAVNQIVKAITSLHDGRTWKPETVAAVIAAIAATGAATVTFILGKRQITSAQKVAQQQIEAAEKNAQRQIQAAKDTADLQIASAQAVAKQQVESAQSVARTQLIMPMREAWIGQLRSKLAEFFAISLDVFVTADERIGEVDTSRLSLVHLEAILMLNPEEPSHVELIKTLQEIADTVAGDRLNEDRLAIALAKGKDLSHSILKSEWRRAKEGT